MVTIGSTKRKSRTHTSAEDTMASTKRRYRPDSLSENAVGKKQKSKERTFYKETLLMTHKRLCLSQNIITLLKHLDEIKLGRMDEDDLSRKIYLSPAFRNAILDAITHCTDLMVQKPSEGADCSLIIKKCTEIMEIASKPGTFESLILCEGFGVTDCKPILTSPDRPIAAGFPFFKLPLELRARIYDLYFESQFRGKARLLRQNTWRPACWDDCPPATTPFNHIDTDLVLTGKRVRDEVLPILYHKYTLSFNCSCTMSEFFLKNSIAAANARSVSFHWRGTVSDTAIPCLYRLPELKHLAVLVSKMTTFIPTKREQEMKRFFNANTTKVSDALGIDELLKVRGLEDVTVKQAPGKGKAATSKVTEETVWSLRRMLKNYVLEAKPDDYGQ